MARSAPKSRALFDDSAIDELERRFEADSSSPYSMGEEELMALLGRIGEMEPVIDALMVLGNQSKRARAEAIGCQESDFDGQD